MKRQIKRLIGKLRNGTGCYCTASEAQLVRTARFQYTYSRALSRGTL